MALTPTTVTDSRRREIFYVSFLPRNAAERGIATPIRLSVRLSASNAEVSWSRTLQGNVAREYFENNFTVS